MLLFLFTLQVLGLFLGIALWPRKKIQEDLDEQQIK